MLLFLVAVLAAAAVLLSLRWWVRRIDTLGRRRPFPAVSVGVALVLAAVGSVPLVRQHLREQWLGEVATALTGRPVQVRCQTRGQEFTDASLDQGRVWFDADGRPVDWTLLKRNICDDLADYARSDHRAPTLDHVRAVHVLSHEARHLAGERQESAAECQAMGQDARAAQLLGADPAQAVALAERYREQIYPFMPDAYRGDCPAPR
ncbi:MAG: hypothetical protein ACRC35_08825 [Angustibacter sp.]